MKNTNFELKSYRVYYFIGDFYSFKGETRKSTIIKAINEDEAELIFKTTYPKKLFGWIEPYRTSRN